MAKDLIKTKEIEKTKESLRDNTLPGLETPDSTKASFFKMKGFPMMEGTNAHRSALKQTIDVGAIVDAAESANDPMMEEQIAASKEFHDILQKNIMSKERDDEDDDNDENETA